MKKALVVFVILLLSSFNSHSYEETFFGPFFEFKKDSNSKVYAFRPIFCKLISSISPKILWGIVILLIIGFIKAISTLAVE